MIKKYEIWKKMKFKKFVKNYLIKKILLLLYKNKRINLISKIYLIKY